jgi:hypothetical protein
MANIYFMYIENKNNEIKIGYANNAAERVAKYKMYKTEKIVIDSAIETPSSQELATALKKIFWPLHIDKEDQEWFRLPLHNVNIIVSAWYDYGATVNERFLARCKSLAPPNISRTEPPKKAENDEITDLINQAGLTRITNADIIELFKQTDIMRFNDRPCYQHAPIRIGDY